MLSDLRVGRSEKVMEFGCYGLEIIGQGRYYLGKVKNVQEKSHLWKFTDALHSPDVEMKIWFMQSKRITLQYSFTYGYQVKFTLDAHFLQVVPGWCTYLLCYVILPNYT